MKAWLITWEWMSKPEEVVDVIAAVINPRRSRRYVADLTEHIYSHRFYYPSELFNIVKNPKYNPYKADIGNLIHGVPHGDRIRCGNHPWLYARVVSDLLIDKDVVSGNDIISWKEPINYRYTNKDKLIVEAVGPPREQSYIRTVSGSFNSNLKYKREEI